MSRSLEFDAEAVAAATNKISVAIEDINTRNNNFAQMLSDIANKNGSLTFFRKAAEKVEIERNNMQQTLEAVESIQQAIRAFTDKAAELDSAEGL